VAESSGAKPDLGGAEPSCGLLDLFHRRCESTRILRHEQFRQLRFGLGSRPASVAACCHESRELTIHAILNLRLELQGRHDFGLAPPHSLGHPSHIDGGARLGRLLPRAGTARRDQEGAQ
jgi:hypothetical protein